MTTTQTATTTIEAVKVGQYIDTIGDGVTSKRYIVRGVLVSREWEDTARSGGWRIRVNRAGHGILSFGLVPACYPAAVREVPALDGAAQARIAARMAERRAARS